jgi:fumarate reductase subunit C
MTRTHGHTDYHPRWLRQPVSTYWWLGKRSYFAFILREGSCLFVGWFVVFLLALFHAVGRGPASYARFLQWSSTPWVLALNVVSLAFMIYHAITFFGAAPRAMVVHIGRRRVPEQFVLGGHYLAWAVASAIVAWLLVGE